MAITVVPITVVPDNSCDDTSCDDTSCDNTSCDDISCTRITCKGLSIWQDLDSVHLTDTAYMEIGMALLHSEEDNNDVFQPPKKAPAAGEHGSSCAGQARAGGKGSTTNS